MNKLSNTYFLSIKDSIVIINLNVKEETIISTSCRIPQRLCNPYAEGLWKVAISYLIIPGEVERHYAFTCSDESVSWTFEDGKKSGGEFLSLMPTFTLTEKDVFLLFRQIKLHYGGSVCNITITNDAEGRATLGMLVWTTITTRWFHCWGLQIWGSCLEFWFFKYKN